MKPKTIESIVERVWNKAVHAEATKDDTSEETIKEALAQIQQLLEECAPIKRTVIKDESLTSAGEQVRYRSLGYNQAIDQYKYNIREKLK